MSHKFAYMGLMLLVSSLVATGVDRRIAKSSYVLSGDCSYAAAIPYSKNDIAYNTGAHVVRLDAMTGHLLREYSLPSSRVASNVVVVNNTIFASGDTSGPCGPIYALSGESSKILWSANYSSCLLWSDGQRLYIQGQGGNGLKALSLATGKELWNADSTSPRFVDRLQIYGGRIYTRDRILNVSTGKTIAWLPRACY